MGEVVVPQPEGFPGAADPGSTGKIGSCPVCVLILKQYAVNFDGNDFIVSVTESESHRCDPSVGVRTEDHLNRDINAQNAFHKNLLSEIIRCEATGLFYCVNICL
jgi:hypothetical protein